MNSRTLYHAEPLKGFWVIVKRVNIIEKPFMTLLKAVRVLCIIFRVVSVSYVRMLITITLLITKFFGRERGGTEL